MSKHNLTIVLFCQLCFCATPQSSAEMNLLMDIHSPRVPYIATPTAQTSVSGQPSNLYFEPNITTDASTLPSHRESLIDFDPGVLPPHRVSPLDKTPNDQDLGNPPMPVQPELAGVFPTIVALQTDGLKVTFDFAKPPGSIETTIIKASYTNLSSRLYTDFVFQAAVPKFMKLQLNPASSNILPPDGSSPVTQMISVNNSLYGQVSITQNSIDSWHHGWGSFQFQNVQLWQAFVGTHEPKRLIYLHLLL
jgi:hypothetical protein